MADPASPPARRRVELVFHADDRASFVLTKDLVRFDRRIFGGTAVAASVEAMEAVTGRTCAWITTQFSGSASVGATIDLHVERMAVGKAMSQLRVTGYDEGRLVWSALGACAVEQEEPPFEGGFAEMPAVLPPEAGPVLRFPGESPDRGFGTTCIRLTLELREALRPDGSPSDVPMLVWGRVVDRPMTRAGLAMVADLGPLVIARAIGRPGTGKSMDNTMRYGPTPTTDWVLLEMLPGLAHGGWAHSDIRLWSEDGTLLGLATQTARIWAVDEPSG